MPCIVIFAISNYVTGSVISGFTPSQDDLGVNTVERMCLCMCVCCPNAYGLCTLASAGTLVCKRICNTYTNNNLHSHSTVEHRVLCRGDASFETLIQHLAAELNLQLPLELFRCSSPRTGRRLEPIVTGNPAEIRRDLHRSCLYVLSSPAVTVSVATLSFSAFFSLLSF